LEVGEPLLKAPQGSGVPPWDFDGFIEQPGGDNNGKMGTAMESQHRYAWHSTRKAPKRLAPHRLTAAQAGNALYWRCRAVAGFGDEASAIR
jgi:hypothetical protein